MALSPGARLGPYEIIEWVGSGGMADVYCAEDTHLGRQVAIACLNRAGAADDAHLVAQRERGQARGLHPPLLAADPDRGLPRGRADGAGGAGRGDG